METAIEQPTDQSAVAGVIVGTINKGEARRLAVLERTIETGMKTFVKVGEALREIRDQRLYRAQFSNFEDYLDVRWHFTQQRAQQLISAAKTVQRVAASTGVDLPSERTTRAFERIERSQGIDAAKAAVQAAAKAGTLDEKSIENAAAAAAPVSKDATAVYVDMLRNYVKAIVRLPVPEGADPALAGRRNDLAKALVKTLTEFFAN